MRRTVNALLAISLAVTLDSAPQSPDADLLARFMAKVRQDLTGIRDCTCLETMSRGRRRPPHTDFAPVDTVRLEVSTIAGKELFANPGRRFDDRDLQSLIRSGTVGSGMFSTFVQNLFIERHGTLRYVRQENVDGRRLVRYDFRATRQESGFKLQVANIAGMVAAKGSFWFDAASLDLVRLEIHAQDIPYDLHLDDAVIHVDYARTHLGDSDALLPKRSEMTLTYISGDADRNTIDFSQCRAYRSDSAIDFGKGTKAAAPTVEKSAPTETVDPAPQPLPETPPPVAVPTVAPPPPLPSPAPPTVPIAPAPEIKLPAPPPSFKSQVNLVMVPVVVRDRKGNAVGGLRKEDFHLFDGNRKQEIAHFSVQTSAAVTGSAAGGYLGPTVRAESPDTAAVTPERLVAYVFDDVDIKFEDLVYSRDAAWRNISESLQPSGRVAIVATSGRTMLDFTNDRDKIHEALFQLRPNRLYRPPGRECPDLNFYQAYAISSGMGGGVRTAHPNRMELNPLLRVAIEDLENCDPAFDPEGHHGHIDVIEEQMKIEAAAARIVSWRDREIDVVLNSLKLLSHRMASMSGQRSIILASPGFLVTDALRPHEMALVDEAIRSGVVINAMDALGLWTMNPAGGIDEPATAGAAHPNVAEEKVPYRKAEVEGGAQSLAVIAESTGGKLIQNSNDYIGAYRQLANPPEYMYILGFAPKDVKPNGSFHALSVKLASGGKYDVQARSGYFAPKPGDDRTAQGAPEIKDAVFSQLEIHTLPAELRAEVDRSDPANLKLMVTVSLDRNRLRGQSDRLTAVVALFDNNGGFVNGNQGNLDLASRAETPLLLKTAFPVKPGDYRVRVVLHDEQAQILEAQNQTVTVR